MILRSFGSVYRSNSKQSSLYYDMASQLRIDFLQAIHQTKSGHPTSCSSITELFSVLFFHPVGMKVNFQHPTAFFNDRLILSKGHAAPLLYSCLYRAGVLKYQELLGLRKKNSLLQGHPVPSIPFVDVATGSLGQGLSVAAGMAYSSKYFDAIDNRVYCVAGDGELAEGSIWEAVEFSKHYSLHNLTLFVDVNRLGQSEPTKFQHNMDIYHSKFRTSGWKVQIIDGHNIEEIIQAIQNARKQTNNPSVILCKTIKGKSFGNKIEDKVQWHGKDLGADTEKVIQHLRKNMTNFSLPFETNRPEELGNKQKGNITITPNYNIDEKISTRKAYGNGLLKARQSNQNVIGLDGDTRGSTFSQTLKNSYADSFIQCFIAEQNLIGVGTGLSCRGKIPFCSSFGAFLTRASDQIRIAGIGRNPIKVVGSHGGCSIGEDGPSQMALQDVSLYRSVPNSVVFCPSDGVSTEKAVQLAGNYNLGPAFIRTTRPDVSILYQNEEPFEIGKCKVVKQNSSDSCVIFSYGVTLHECLKVYQALKLKGIHVRIVDLFCLKPLDQEEISRMIQQCQGKVLVVQDHYQSGGAHEAICGSCSPSIKIVKHLFVRQIPGSAKPHEQYELQGLDAKNIEKQIHSLLF